MSLTVPAEVIYNMLTTDWDRGNVPVPSIIQRETTEELREEIPDSGLVSIYAESGGFRISPRGNRMYKDETVNVTLEVHTLKSHEHLHKLQEEIIRIVEENTRTVEPFQIVRPLSYSEQYGRTFQYWRGEVKLELNRVAIRTGYAGPSS